MRGSVILAVIAAALVAPAGAGAANDGFIEHVRVLHEWHGAPDGYFGWAVSELGDVDDDGVGDFITSEPLTGGGITWVYSGGSGDPIYRLEGAPGDFQGTAIADAGDTDGDGVHDILSGASGDGVLMPGRAYLYSGSTGELMHTWEGEGAGDQFGYAVASAGDQDGDGRADVLVGAATADGAAGTDAGAAYVYSGDSYEQLRRIGGADAGDGHLEAAARTLSPARPASSCCRSRSRPARACSATSSSPGWDASTATRCRMSTPPTTTRTRAAATRPCSRATTARSSTSGPAAMTTEPAPGARRST